MTTVVVLGATGTLGERVCRLMQRWVPSALLVGANRSGRGHRDFPVRKVDVRDDAELRALLPGADLVVNAIGPYTYDPSTLVRACIRSRCHYVDLAEDLRFLSRVERAAKAAGAQQAGVCLVPGCSTLPGLVELLASRWHAHPDVARVTARLSMGSRNPVSRALLVGLLAPLGRPGPDGQRWFTRLEQARASDGRRLVYGSYPAAFPRQGMRLGMRRVPVSFWMGFDRAWLTRGLALGARVLGRLPERSLPSVATLALPFGALARLLGSPRGVLSVEPEDARGHRLGRIEVHAVAAGLDVPAAPPVWVARRLVAEGSLKATGAVGLARAVPLGDALGWLREAGYRVEVEPGGGRPA